MIISSQSETDAIEFVKIKSFAVATFKVVNQINKSFIKNDVKIKVVVFISDKSNDNTSLEKIVYVKKVEHDSRVIVNRDTKKNLYFNIHWKTIFKKKIVKE